MFLRFIDKFRKVFRKEEDSEESFQIKQAIENIAQLLIVGNYDSVLEELETLTHQDLETDEYLSCEVLRSQCMLKLGKYDEALEVAKKVVNKTQKEKGLEIVAIDAIIIRVEILWRLGKLDESLESIEQGEHLVNLLDEQLLDIKPQKASLVYHKGVVYFHKGILIQALDYHKKALAFREELGNNQEIAQSLNTIGAISHLRGDLDTALDYYQQSLALKEKLGNKQDIAKSLNNIGVIFYLKGEFDQALEYYRMSLALKEELGHKHDIAFSLNNIGSIYLFKGDLGKAQEYYSQSKLLFEEIGNNMQLAESLFNLINVNIDKDEIEEAKQYLEQLRGIDEQEDNKRINQQYRIAEALILKTSTRARNRGKAEELLEEVIKEPVVDHEVTVLAMLNLAELFLFELQTSPEEELLTDLKQLTNQLHEIAKDQRSSSLIAETCWLQAQLALVESDLKKAKRLLYQAQTMAEERGLHRLARRLSDEHDKLIEEIDKWEELSSRGASITERIEEAGLNKLISHMRRKSEVESPEEKEEKPVLLLLIANTGIPVFTKQFLLESELDDVLISGFLTSINITLRSFMNEAFAGMVSESEKQVPIERIKYKDYTVVLEFSEPFMFCYAFTGQSYSAIHKIEQFITKMRDYPEIWKSLEDVSKIGEWLNAEDSKLIEGLIGEVF